MGHAITFEGLKALARRIAPFALFGALTGAVIAALAAQVMPDYYEATARVEIDAQRPAITVNPDNVKPGGPVDSNLVDTEVQLFKAPEVAREVARAGNLAHDPEFAAATLEDSARKFERALDIRRAAETSLIDITVRSTDPVRAARLANLTASSYVALAAQRQRRETEAANRLLRQRVDEMAGEVRRAEEAVQAYRIGNGLMSVNGTTLAEQSAAVLTQDLATARAAERAAQAELAAASGAATPTALANTQNSLGELRARQAEAQQAMAEAAARFGPRHPSYVAARERLDQIDQAVAAETARAQAAVGAGQRQRIDDLRGRAAAASNLRASLEGSAGANAAGLARNSRAATELADLERKAGAVRQTYETYLNRYQQTLSQLGTEQTAAHPVASALAPAAPISLSPLRAGLLGGGLGALAGLVLVAGLMLFEGHLSTAAQIEREFSVDALPPLPTARSGELTENKGSVETGEIAALMRGAPHGTYAEAFKALATALDRPLDGGGRNRVVALTSALPGEGKTAASICLAQAAAMAGRRVLLVDADMRKHSASRALVPDIRHGLGEVLEGTIGWRAAVLPGPVEGLSFLPNHGRPGDADMLAREATLAECVRQWRDAFDLVILDTAPILPVADTRTLVRHVDSAVVICRWRDTPRRAVGFALEELGRAGAPIAGIALAQVDLTAQATYGLGDPTFYYRRYRSYYQAA